MGLMKAPSLLTFLIALVLAAAAVSEKFGLLPVAVLAGYGFWLMCGAFVVLVLGVITRGL